MVLKCFVGLLLGWLPIAFPDTNISVVIASDTNTQLIFKQKYGKNAILKGINFEEGATGRDRNRQIGGHHE